MTKKGFTMIQDILPHIFCNDFLIKTAEPSSYFLYFLDGRLLLSDDDSKGIPQFEALEGCMEDAMSHCDYLFSIDQMDFYLVDESEI
jgi:NAD+ diphosphatase